MRAPDILTTISVGEHAFVSPLQGDVFIVLLPRALPWAKESGAVGTTKKLTFH
jgi:hypothetical protein